MNSEIEKILVVVISESVSLSINNFDMKQVREKIVSASMGVLETSRNSRRKVKVGGNIIEVERRTNEKFDKLEKSGKGAKEKSEKIRRNQVQKVSPGFQRIREIFEKSESTPTSGQEEDNKVSKVREKMSIFEKIMNPEAGNREGTSSIEKVKKK